MCGECCKRYLIPVYSADIRRISEFTGLEPKEFLELIIPDESVACTYDGVPKISLRGESGKVLVLKEQDDVCMFLKDKKCAVYQARPLRCRPFPLGYRRRRGKFVFRFNEEAAEFCKGLGRETGSDLEKLKSAALAMHKEQSIFGERVRLWNSSEIERASASHSMDDLLKFLIPNNRAIHAKPRNCPIQ